MWRQSVPTVIVMELPVRDRPFPPGVRGRRRTSNSLFAANSIFNTVPIANVSCGILEDPGAGTAGGTEEDNKIFHTTVNDGYCGVAHVASTHVEFGKYSNTLYTELASDFRFISASAC